MLSNRGRDTGPELAVRRLVHARGLRYRVDYAPLQNLRRYRADLVFTRAKVAVFIDGCFWHGCPQHHTQPKTNAQFWTTKVTTNRARDLKVTDLFHDAGWTVLRFWEHDDPRAVALEIERQVGAKPAKG